MSSLGYYTKINGKDTFVRSPAYYGGKTQKSVRMGPNNTNKVIKFSTGSYSPPAPAPAPAPSFAAASSAAQNPLAIDNPYKDEADRLLQTIKDMEAAKPKTMISSSQAVNPSNLTIAASGSQPKQSGSGSFKRRKTATTTSANLRTINSVNI